MPIAEIGDNVWYFPLVRTTEDKSSGRCATAPDKSYELVGFDGSVNGGLRPLSGFLKVLELDPTADPNHDGTSQVLDFKPVSFRIGGEGYGYGLVYKIHRRLTGDVAVFAPIVSSVHVRATVSDHLTVDPVEVLDGALLLCVVSRLATAGPSAVVWSNQYGSESGEGTEQDFLQLNTKSGPASTVEMWYLRQPAFGTGFVEVTMPSSTECSCAVYVIYGADPDAPIDVTRTDTDDDTATPDIQVTPTGPNRLLVGAFVTQSTLITKHNVTTPNGIPRYDLVTGPTPALRHSGHTQAVTTTSPHDLRVSLTGFSGTEDTIMVACSVRKAGPAGVSGGIIQLMGTANERWNGRTVRETFFTTPPPVSSTTLVQVNAPGSYSSSAVPAGTQLVTLFGGVRGYGATAGVRISNVTWQPTAGAVQTFTQAINPVIQTQAGSDDAKYSMNAWYLVNPAPGNGTMQVTFASTVSAFHIAAYNIGGAVDTADPIATVKIDADIVNTGQASSASLSGLPTQYDIAGMFYSPGYGQNFSGFANNPWVEAPPGSPAQNPGALAYNPGAGDIAIDFQTSVPFACPGNPDDFSAPQADFHAVVSAAGGHTVMTGVIAVRSTGAAPGSGGATSSGALTSVTSSGSVETSASGPPTSTSVSSASGSASGTGGPDPARPADVFIDYFNSRTGVWTHGTKLVENVDPAMQMDVAVFGRLVYVFTECRDPTLFWLEEGGVATSGPPPTSGGPETWTERVLGGTDAGPFPGPGPRPTLEDVVDVDVAVPIPKFQDVVDDQPLTARVIISERALDAFGVGSSSSAGEPSGSDPLGGGLLFDAAQLKRLEELGQHLLDPGDYTFMCYLYDSRTGRKSQPSSLAVANLIAFSDVVGSEGAGTEITDTAAHFAYMEGVYDPTKFDQLWVYRSTMSQSSGGPKGAATLWLDGIVELDQIETTVNDGGSAPVAPLRHFMYPYRLDDKQLTLQPPYLDLILFDEGMPKGGSAIIYENTMVVGKVCAPSTNPAPTMNSAIAGLGEIRWSSTVDFSPELFPPLNRYVPPVPSNEVMSFHLSADNVIGMARDRLYHVRKAAQFMTIEEMHEGYGAVAQHAATALGGLVIFLNHRGMKQVSTNGELEDIRAIDALVVRDWLPTALGDVSVAFDPVAGSLFVFNPRREQTAVFWTNTGMVTELADLPFMGVRQGVWPTDPRVYTDPLVSRAIWVQNHPYPQSTGWTTGFKPRVYVLDIHRSKRVSGASDPETINKSRLAVLDFQGDSIATLNAQYNGGDTMELEGDAFDVDNLIGARVYSGNANPLLADLSARIIRVELLPGPVPTTRLTLHPEDTDKLTGMLAGDQIMLSPVVCRWQGRPLGLEIEGTMFGAGYEYTTIRQMHTIAATFEGLAGGADELGTTLARWEALVYRGEDVTPTSRAFPRTNEGDLYRSVVNGASQRHVAPSAFEGITGPLLVPGIQVVCPDLDFRLLGAYITGTIRTATRGTFTTP